MLDKTIYYIKKYESVLLYLIFGVLTTFVNIVVYYILFNHVLLSNILSNGIAWVAAVIFAFITNKIWVFKSKTLEIEQVIKELIAFFSARLSTGLLDMAIMYVGVDLLKVNSIYSKIISGVVVVILNYIFSKLFIFRKNKE
ncbi:GtrA family protein [Lachnoanaerobaculum sp. Marseille-Q4761]|jgi:cell wall teichoic acid glycosylation protein gtcA|uniref:GtrA family protein n=1 Tax=Lachnoanaerobaculum sp. Marseille-Q4761 TaxID=2819511 RepID=UPI000F2AB7B6|nr:GtrA family protein [Lachnoanaerobaculum sp. Marseille-Q4761]MBO1870224.1 GtrA family protein [Lachnoanaerobaculum sp. Marseille-Q4761]RKW56629.1 MAG: GtrA family protein [Lachnospiraceae bacterium]